MCLDVVSAGIRGVLRRGSRIASQEAVINHLKSFSLRNFNLPSGTLESNGAFWPGPIIIKEKPHRTWAGRRPSVKNLLCFAHVIFHVLKTLKSSFLTTLPCNLLILWISYKNLRPMGPFAHFMLRCAPLPRVLLMLKKKGRSSGTFRLFYLYEGFTFLTFLMAQLPA